MPAERAKIEIPDDLLMGAGILFGKAFPSGRSLPRRRGHPVMVVPQLVEEDMQELEGTDAPFRELGDVPRRPAVGRARGAAGRGRRGPRSTRGTSSGRAPLPRHRP